MEHDPAARDASSTGPPAAVAGLQSRLEAVEQQVAAWANEVRTQRLVVVDATGAERVVTQVAESFAEVRLHVGDARRRLQLVLVAAREPSDPRGSAAGVEVWLDGDHVGGFTITPER